MADDRFRVDPLGEGKIELEVTSSDGSATKIAVAHEHAALMAAALLSAAKASQERSGLTPAPSASLAGTITFVPSGLGLSSDSPVPDQQTCLVIHAGQARLAIAIANARELGQALLAASATVHRRQ